MAKARRRTAKKKKSPRKHRRHTRKTRRAAPAAPKRRRRKARRATEAKTIVKAPVRRRRRRRVHAPVVAAPVVQASRPRRRKKRKASPRRRRKVRAWRGNSAGHASAAKKGWRRRKHKKAAAPRRRKHRRRSRKAREMVMQAPRRHRRRSHRRRHMRMFASRSGGSMRPADMAAAIVCAGLGFVLADGLDRFLATYDPAAAPPADKFTSSGVGTLGNTLNVASRPSMIRLGAGAGAVVLPAVLGRMPFVRSPMVRSSLDGLAVGAGIKLFSTLWDSVLMPLLLPKDTSAPSLQKNIIARLYPAEVAAHLNLKAQQMSGPGALSGADVGPFALSGDSPYPDTAQALRDATGVREQFPTVEQVLGTGGPGGDYPTVTQMLRQKEAGLSEDWTPGTPPGQGPGPQTSADASCGCIGEANPFMGFVGEELEESVP